jgi:hypothetical protein
VLLPSICLDITVTTTVTIDGNTVVAPPPVVASAPPSVAAPMPTPPPVVVAPAPPAVAPAVIAAPSAVAPAVVVVASPPRMVVLHPVLLAVAAGAGLGFDTKDHCEDLQCAAVAIDIGVALHPGFYAVLAAQLWDSPEHPGAARHHAETLGLRVQGARVWGEAGLGIGSTRTEDWYYGIGYMKQDIDIAASAGVGYDALVRPTYALGVQARASTTPDVEHTLVSALLLGITWY